MPRPLWLVPYAVWLILWGIWERLRGHDPGWPDPRPESDWTDGTDGI